MWIIEGQIREVLCSTVYTVVMCVDYRGADQRGSLFYCTYSCHVCGLWRGRSERFSVLLYIQLSCVWIIEGQIREVLCSTVHTVVMCVDYRGADQRGSLFYCTYSCHVCGL